MLITDENCHNCRVCSDVFLYNCLVRPDYIKYMNYPRRNFCDTATGPGICCGTDVAILGISTRTRSNIIALDDDSFMFIVVGLLSWSVPACSYYFEAVPAGLILCVGRVLEDSIRAADAVAYTMLAITGYMSGVAMTAVRK